VSIVNKRFQRQDDFLALDAAKAAQRDVTATVTYNPDLRMLKIDYRGAEPMGIVDALRLAANHLEATS
jgi:hypothetical protein